MNYNTFLIRFGIEPDNFKPIESIPIKTDTGYLYYLEQRTDTNRVCPYCNSKNIVINDYSCVTINCSTNSNCTEKLRIKKVRYKCKRCGKTFTPEIKGIIPYANISDFSKSDMVNDFFENYTFTQIAKKYKVSIGYAIKLFDDTIGIVPRGKLSEIICIDEFHFTKIYDQNYCVAITDFVSSNIIDILKNRKKAYLEEYFNTFSIDELEKVKIYISDMYDEYREIKRKYFPNAIHIVDMFHIINQLTTAINVVRNKILKEHIIEAKSPEYNFAKKNWKLFLCRKSKIPNKYYTYMKTGEIFSYEELVFRCVKKDSDFNLAYITLQDMFKYKSRFIDMDAEKWIDYISNRLISSERDEIKKVGRTYQKWKVEIVNAYSKEAREKLLTNAKAERMNGLIRNILKAANGYNNFERFRKRTLLIYKYKKGQNRF